MRSEGKADVVLQPLGSQSFDYPISLTCSGLPAGATCSFSPATLTLGQNSGKSVITIEVPATTAAAPQLRKPQSGRALLALFLAPFGFVVMVRPKRRATLCLGLAVMVGAMLLLQSCGGGGGSSSGITGGGGSSGGTGGGGGKTASTYNVKVIAKGANDQHTTTLTLTIP